MSSTGYQPITPVSNPFKKQLLALTKAVLIRNCKKYKVSTHGTKLDLIERIIAAKNQQKNKTKRKQQTLPSFTNTMQYNTSNDQTGNVNNNTKNQQDPLQIVKQAVELLFNSEDISNIVNEVFRKQQYYKESDIVDDLSNYSHSNIITWTTKYIQQRGVNIIWTQKSERLLHSLLSKIYKDKITNIDLLIASFKSIDLSTANTNTVPNYKLQQLVAFGFDKESASIALQRSNNDINVATDYLTDSTFINVINIPTQQQSFESKLQNDNSLSQQPVNIIDSNIECTSVKQCESLKKK
eukprot:90136_1